MNEYLHCQVDLETMGLRPNAAIVAIGAAFFNEDSIGPTFYTPVSLHSCLDQGLVVDKSTQDWWATQPAEIRAAWDVPNPPELLDALTQFSVFLRQAGSEVRVWANGADFDPVLLKSAYETLDADPPWKFFNQRCHRTIQSMFPVDVPRSNAHHALEDAKYQAMVIQKICQVHGFNLK